MKPIARNSTSPIWETLDRFEHVRTSQKSTERFNDYLGASRSNTEICPIICRIPYDNSGQRSAADPSQTSKDQATSDDQGSLGIGDETTSSDRDVLQDQETTDGDIGVPRETESAQEADPAGIAVAQQTLDAEGLELAATVEEQERSIAADNLAEDHAAALSPTLASGAVAAATLAEAPPQDASAQGSATAPAGSNGLVEAVTDALPAVSQSNEAGFTSAAAETFGEQPSLVDSASPVESAQQGTEGQNVAISEATTAAAGSRGDLPRGAEPGFGIKGSTPAENSRGPQTSATGSPTEGVALPNELLVDPSNPTGQEASEHDQRRQLAVETPEVRGSDDATEADADAVLQDGNRNGSGNTTTGLVSPRATESRHQIQLNASQQRRFVQRVAKAFELAQQRGGEIRLRLSPPALGSLKVEIKLEGQQLSARLEAESQAAKQLLMEHLPALRDRLSEQGISIESFEVDLYHEEPRDTTEDHREARRRQASDERSLATKHPTETELEVPTIDSLNRIEQRALNVIV